jgi:TPR repeat protein
LPIGPEDYREAVEQYRKLAEQGYLHAQFMLFEIYGDGLLLDFAGSLWRPPGIAEDKAEAYKWLLLAAINDYKGAMLNRLLKNSKYFEQGSGWYVRESNARQITSPTGVSHDD